MDYTRTLTRLTDAKIEYSQNIPLAQYTSFRIGGEAKIAVFPKSCDEATTVFDILCEEGIPTVVLGNGTNVLVSDDGYNGAAVILSGLRSCTVSDEFITADAGVSLTHLALTAAKHSLTGLEFAYGIPGTLGGAIYMNAGAYGGDMSQVTVSSRYYDLESGELGKIEGDAHEFAYRHSVYMDTAKVILSVTLRLAVGERCEIEAKMNDFMSRRREKQPLEYPSAGSTFKRGNGFITSQVIDEVGLKGRCVGGAQVSEKHAGFVINKGGATANDVLSLIDIIKAEVKQKTGYDIECEVRYIGN